MVVILDTFISQWVWVLIPESWFIYAALSMPLTIIKWQAIICNIILLITCHKLQYMDNVNCKCPKNSEKNDIFVFYYKKIL